MGAAADEWGKIKEEKYRDMIDPNKATFLPFIMETQGGIGKAAQDFIIKIEEKKRQSSCSLSKTRNSVANHSLMISLSLQLQLLQQ